MQHVFLPPPYISDEDELTIRTYNEEYFNLERMALVQCKWEGVPEEVDPMIIERYLYYFGQVVFFYDEIAQAYAVLPYATEFAWDLNGMPTAYEVVGFRGYRRRLDYTNSVIIWNNYQMTPSMEMAALLSTRLTNALRVTDMHLEAQKIGKLIVTPETKKRGVLEIIRRIKNFHLFTVISQAGLGIKDSVEVLDTELNYIGHQIDAHYQFLWHKALSYFGVTSTPNKQAGVSQYEVASEDGAAVQSRKAIIYPRQDAVKKINKMFGLNIRVSLDMEEGENDGELHNDTENSAGSNNGEDNPGQS